MASIDAVANFGADPSGVGDSTAALQAALDALATRQTTYTPATATELFIPPGVYRISATLVWGAGASAKVLGAGKWCTKLRWAGPPKRDMLRLVNCRTVSVGCLNLDANGIAVSSMLSLETDTTAFQQGAPQGSPFTSTMNELHDLSFYGSNSMAAGAPRAAVGLRIARGGGQDTHNDYHYFRRLEIELCGSGILITQGQQKGSLFEMCNVNLCDSGVRTQNLAGAFHWLGGFMHTNQADFNLEAVADAVVISHMGSENSGRFIDNPGDSGNGWPLTVIGCRWASDGLVADQRMMRLGKCGPYQIKGNTFGWSDRKKPRIYVYASTPSALELEGNNFDSSDSVDTDPVELRVGSLCKVSKRRNTYRTNGANRTMARRAEEVGDIHYSTTAALPAVAQLPLPNDLGIHRNSADARVYLAFNDAGIVKGVELAVLQPPVVINPGPGGAIPTPMNPGSGDSGYSASTSAVKARVLPKEPSRRVKKEIPSRGAGRKKKKTAK